MCVTLCATQLTACGRRLYQKTAFLFHVYVPTPTVRSTGGSITTNLTYGIFSPLEIKSPHFVKSSFLLVGVVLATSNGYVNNNYFQLNTF